MASRALVGRLLMGVSDASRPVALVAGVMVVAVVGANLVTAEGVIGDAGFASLVVVAVSVPEVLSERSAAVGALLALLVAGLVVITIVVRLAT